MELRQLHRFLAVVEHGSLAAAAKHLGLTQQALSASLATLEEELGTRLFDRSPGGITRPTVYGHTLIPHARSQLAGAARALQALRNVMDGQVGTVTVGVGESFAGDIIAAAVTRMHAGHAAVRVNIIEGYSEQLLTRLYEGEFDFIAAGVSHYKLADGFVREIIYTTNDVVACRPEHPLTKRRDLQLADLVGQPWLVPYSRKEDLGIIVEAFVAEDLEPPTRIIGSDAYRIGMQLLTGNDFLIMCSPALIGPEIAGPDSTLRVLDIDRPTVRRNASLIYPKDRPLAPQAARLLEEVRLASRHSGREWLQLRHRTADVRRLPRAGAKQRRGKQPAKRKQPV